MNNATEDIDLDDPSVRRQVQQKARLRSRSQEQPRGQQSGKSKGSGGVSAAAREWPGGAPGQHAVKKWVVLDLGKRPSKASYDPWTLGDAFSIAFTFATTKGHVAGGDEDGVSFHECALTLGELREAAGGSWLAMPESDWHCVTGWSCFGVRFRGVPWAIILRTLANKVKNQHTPSSSPSSSPDASSPSPLRDDWRCLYQRSADKYTAPVHRDDLDGAFLAVTDGEGVMLSEEHGGPRLVFPKCFGWKSAKFLTHVRLLPEHRPGFWEKLGCHARGRWALEERWAPGTSARVWNVLAWITDRYRVLGGEWVWERVMVHGGRWLGGVADVVDWCAGRARAFAASAQAWGEKDRKWRRKRRKALKSM